MQESNIAIGSCLWSVQRDNAIGILQSIAHVGSYEGRLRLHADSGVLFILCSSSSRFKLICKGSIIGKCNACPPLHSWKALIMHTEKNLESIIQSCKERIWHEEAQWHQCFGCSCILNSSSCCDCAVAETKLLVASTATSNSLQLMMDKNNRKIINKDHQLTPYEHVLSFLKSIDICGNSDTLITVRMLRTFFNSDEVKQRMLGRRYPITRQQQTLEKMLYWLQVRCASDIFICL